MSQVVYARVPDSLKEALDAYAASYALTLTASVIDLLGRGLSAVSDEASVAELQARLATEADRRRQLEAEIQASRVELAALEMLRQRSSQRVASCPACQADVTGYDVLAVNSCPSCQQTLASLTAGAGTADVADQRQMLLLLGAIGTVVGIAWLASRTT